jgi:hypothetical protein
MRLLISALLLATISAALAAAKPLRAPVVSSGAFNSPCTCAISERSMSRMKKLC